MWISVVALVRDENSGKRRTEFIPSSPNGAKPLHPLAGHKRHRLLKESSWPMVRAECPEQTTVVERTGHLDYSRSILHYVETSADMYFEHVDVRLSAIHYSCEIP